MLIPEFTAGIYRCPETNNCLHGARLLNSRIAEHWRNVPGPCPWVGMKVIAATTCECGLGPWISLRQLRLFIRKNLFGPLTSIDCPGLCAGPDPFVAVIDNYVADHPRDTRTRCPWSGTRIAAMGAAPPLFLPEH